MGLPHRSRRENNSVPLLPPFLFYLLCFLVLVCASACSDVLRGFVGVGPQTGNYAEFELVRMVSV